MTNWFIDTITAFATVCLVIVGTVQLNRFINQIKVDFTYRVYQDLLKWLKDHKETREWIFSPGKTLLRPNYNRWEFDDYLSFFESLWTLYRKNLADRDLIYTLFSDYLISVYENNNNELSKIIKGIRKKERKPDLYIGVDNLYLEMKK